MNFGVTEVDDGWHRPTTDDPFWTETIWLRFAVPERSLTGILYPIFRPNQGVGSLAVYLWDGKESVEHDALYVHRMFTCRSRTTCGTSSCSAASPTGASRRSSSITCTTTTASNYGSICATRVCTPPWTTKPPPGHQLLPTVTCLGLAGAQRRRRRRRRIRTRRGSAWGVRPDLRPPPQPDDPAKVIGHADTYAVSGETTFFMGSAGDLTTTNAHSGFHMRDGEIARIVDGQRTVTRTSTGAPDTIEVRATDALGRGPACGRQVCQSPVHAHAELCPLVERCAMDRRRRSAMGRRRRRSRRTARTHARARRAETDVEGPMPTRRQDPGRGLGTTATRSVTSPKLPKGSASPISSCTTTSSEPSTPIAHHR